MGNWKNVEELEEYITLDELEHIIKAIRDKEERANRFTAALKGIDLDEGAGNVEGAQDKIEEIKRRIQAKSEGKSAEQIEMREFGLDMEEG